MSSYGRRDRIKTCSICGFTPQNWAEMSDHLVKEHGFIREASGMVYKPKKCQYCDKTALYKVNKTGYCRDHKNFAVTRMQTHAKMVFEPCRSAMENTTREVDKALRNVTPRNFGLGYRSGSKEKHNRMVGLK